MLNCTGPRQIHKALNSQELTTHIDAIKSLMIYNATVHLFVFHADMTRQYKTMQMQLENRIEILEGMMRKLQGELGVCKLL